jgi:hypothetical protein
MTIKQNRYDLILSPEFKKYKNPNKQQVFMQLPVPADGINNLLLPT